MNPFIPAIETASPAAIKAFQEEQLRALVGYVLEHSPYYKAFFATNGLRASDIHSLEDLQKLPVTTKDDLYRHNQDFICVPPAQIIDYITTSGTLGDPVTFVMTEKDLERLAYNEALSLTCTGGHSGEVYQLMTTLDRRFMAGLAYFMGARKMGAGVIRVGNGMPEFQWDTIQRLKPTAAIAVPSFFLKLIEFAEQQGIDYKNSSLKKVICIGEPIRRDDFQWNTLGQRIRDKWDLELYSTYASTEMGAAFTECEGGQGGHHHPELLIVEILDEQNQPVQPGETGELTVSTLGVQGMPLLRFKTGDLCRAIAEPCACGRTTLRLSPILGRRQQMIKYKGTTLYPPALYDILNHIPEVKNYIVEVYTNDLGTDDLRIRVGCPAPSDALEKEIKDHFRARLRVAPTLQFELPETITRLQFPEMSRKAVTFVDLRQKL